MTGSPHASASSHQRARVVIRGENEEVARRVTLANVGVKAEEMDRIRDSQRSGQPAVWTRMSPAADQQVDRPCSRAIPGSECPQQRLQALEREVVAHEQADDVAWFQPQQVAKRAPDRARLSNPHAIRIDGVGDDVNPLAGNVLELLKMPPHHVADRDHASLEFRGILPALHRPVDRVFGVEHLAQNVEPAHQGTREASRIGLQAAGVHPPWGMITSWAYVLTKPTVQSYSAPASAAAELTAKFQICFRRLRPAAGTATQRTSGGSAPSFQLSA